MADNDDAFLRRLQATFRAEARERLQTLSSALVALENTQSSERQQALIESVFREVHSLKGAARAVDKHDVETLCQALESLLSALKRNEFEFSPTLADLLLKASDLLSRLLQNGAVPELAQDLAKFCARLDEAASGSLRSKRRAAPAINTLKEPAPPIAERAPVGADTVRISTAKLDSLLLQVEGLLTVKQTSAQRIADLADLNGEIAVLKKEHAKIADDVRLLQQRLARNEIESDRSNEPALRKLLEVFSRQDTLFKTVDARLGALSKAVMRDNFSASGMVDALLDDIKKTSMLPVASVFNIFPKLARDLAHSSGKEIELMLRGGEIEIDRRILEEIRDPLIHLVRNAIDHGIETPALRAQAGKSPRGALQLEAAQQEGKIQLLIADDGAGIDRARVRVAAQRLGAIDGDTIVDDAQSLGLIFESGLSTSPMVTDISGRGLGLAIVREKIEALGGSIAVTSTVGGGTQFRLTLPLTLATYRGVHVLSGGRQFIFPLTYVERVTQFRRGDVSLVQNREAVTWSGRAIALARLSDLLELPCGETSAADTLPVVIGAIADKRVAFLVDAIVGEQEVLVKNLGRQLVRVRNVAAATVLGNGGVALILNMLDLFKSTAVSSGRALMPTATEVQSKSILVAEDSITSRMLLRGMLETAGYRVTVAVDGEDAFAKLRAGEFDLLVSDVDMPRLSGFDLATRVRSDQQLQALPIVLVTSLASAADRERGIDVGASAYIVKSNFEESNLLDVIARLL
ncbi:MAG TPA: hybrid sensor histidine kinase/response regulator [Spongiibacteraceae bacterium]